MFENFRKMWKGRNSSSSADPSSAGSDFAGQSFTSTSHSEEQTVKKDVGDDGTTYHFRSTLNGRTKEKTVKLTGNAEADLRALNAACEKVFGKSFGEVQAEQSELIRDSGQMAQEMIDDARAELRRAADDLQREFGQLGQDFGDL